MQYLTGFNDPYEIVKVSLEQLADPTKISDVLCHKKTKIIDFGCGTGLLGNELSRNGFD